MELPSRYCDSRTARFHILPIPFEATVCFESGTEKGPEAILEVSDQMEHIDEETFRLFYLEGIYTHSPIEPSATPAEEMARITETVEKLDLFRSDRFPIFLGGEHSVTPPIIRVAAQKYPCLSILQFDAHSDLRESYPPGGKESHASAMRRVLEITPHLVQVGIRSFCESDLEECPEQVKRFITPIDLEERFDTTLQTILDRLKNNVYITFDMDAFDPAFAPGVGTPEPGGITWRQATRIIRAVSEAKNVIGADIVETMPLGDRQKVTEFMAARLVAKIIAYNTQN